jgi:hypothetical protein
VLHRVAERLGLVGELQERDHRRPALQPCNPLDQDAAEPMDVVDEAQAFVTAWRTAGRLVGG